MSRTNNQLTIMFADVVGSTLLYDQLGDRAAKQCIEQSLAICMRITATQQGTVIKTIGDEIMVSFRSPDHAVLAACAIQSAHTQLSSPSGQALCMRIGLQFGPVIEEGGDLFGDAVNMAARMATVANEQQIITTEATIRALEPNLQAMARPFDRALVKGKQQEVMIYEILWGQDDVTNLSWHDSVSRTVSNSLELHYQSKAVQLTRESLSFSLGRSTQCKLIIGAPLASRLHAHLEYRRGKFVLVDHSTNGTYIQSFEGRNLYLRREELPIVGKGLISLGESVSPTNKHLIRFTCK